VRIDPCLAPSLPLVVCLMLSQSVEAAFMRVLFSPPSSAPSAMQDCELYARPPSPLRAGCASFLPAEQASFQLLSAGSAAPQPDPAVAFSTGHYLGGLKRQREEAHASVFSCGPSYVPLGAGRAVHISHFAPPITAFAPESEDLDMECMPAPGKRRMGAF
jgi:hypothetical protein